MYFLPPITLYQQSVVDNIVHKNVVVDGVAGSGKTTTIYYLAQHYRFKTLVLTYSDNLKNRMISNLQSIGLTNVTVYTYAGFARQFLGKELYGSYNRRNFNEVLEKELESCPDDWQLIIFDEVQDLNKSYYWLCMKLLGHNKAESRICVIGDKMQCIYEAENFGDKFLTLAHILFSADLQWFRIYYNHSFRLSIEMAFYINTEVLRTNLITSNRSNALVVENLWLKHTEWMGISNTVIALFQKNICMPHDIAIIYPSNLNRSQPLFYTLSKIRSAIKTYTSFMQHYGESEQVTFATFRQMKGLEAKIVIILGFDSSEHKWWRYSQKQVECPPEWYVALTRASHKLLLFSFVPAERYLASFPVLPFLSSFSAQTKLKVVENNNYISIYKLVKGLSSRLISKFANNMDIKKTHIACAKLIVPYILEQSMDDKKEIKTVDRITSYLVLIEYCTKFLNMIFPNYKRESSYLEKITWIYNMLTAKLGDNYIELNNFSWLFDKEAEIAKSVNRFQDLMLRHNLEIYKILSYKSPVADVTIRDMVHVVDSSNDIKTLWIVVMTAEVTELHAIHALIYGYMYYKETELVPQINIYNPLINTKWKIEISLHHLILAAETVINSYEGPGELTDEKFIKCLHSM